MAARLCGDGLLHPVLAVEVDGVDTDGVGEFQHRGDGDAVRLSEPLELALHPAEGVLLALGVEQRDGVHAAFGGGAADGTGQWGGGELGGQRDGQLGFHEGLAGPGGFPEHEASGGRELLGSKGAAGRDVELGEPAADPDQGSFAGVQVVVHLSVGGPWGKGLFAVEVAGIESGCGGDFDGVESREPSSALAADESAGAEKGALGLAVREQGGDGGTGGFGLRLDGGNEWRGVDRYGLPASVTAGKAVLNLLVGGADHGHPSHRPAHPPLSSGQFRPSWLIVSSRSDDTLVL